MRATIERPLPPIGIPSGFAGPSPISLPAVHNLLGISIRLSVTCTGNTTIHQDALARSVTFRYKFGTSPSVSLPGNVLLHRNQLLNRVAEDYTEIPAGAGPNVGTWNTFIPRARLHALQPLVSMDDMSGADDPQLEVNFNGIGSISRTGGAAITAITCVATAVLMPRKAGPRIGRIRPHVLMNAGQITAALAASADQTFKVRSGYRNSLIMLIAETNNPGAADIARSDALVTAVEHVVNLGKRGKQNWTDLRTRNRAQATLAPATGIVFFDYDQTRQLRTKDLFDLRGIETFELGLDTAALPNNLRLWVYQEELIDPDPEARRKVGLPAWN
jgi:hypothetical protein